MRERCVEGAILQMSNHFTQRIGTGGTRVNCTKAFESKQMQLTTDQRV